MTKHATSIRLAQDEAETLREWLRLAEVYQRLAERAKIVLLAAEGKTTQEIAGTLGTRPARVSKWRTRFAAGRLHGLSNRVKTGRPPRYGADAEARILRLLEQAPPRGQSTWTGTLVAEVLGDVSADQVWRVLRDRGIRLARRRREYRGAKAEFGPKLVDIVGFCLDVSSGAVVVSAGLSGDLTWEPGVLRIPDSRLADAFKSGPGGAPVRSLVDALETATKLAQQGRFVGPGRRGIAEFLADLAAAAGQDTLHVLLSRDGAARFDIEGVRYYAATSYEEWLGAAGLWAAVLDRSGDRDAPRRLMRAIHGFISAAHLRNAGTFEWSKWVARKGDPPAGSADAVFAE